MRKLKFLMPTMFLMLLGVFVYADEEEVVEGSKHIISLDLEARFEINDSGNERGPRDSGSGSGFLFNYQHIFGLGIDINADHSAPLFMYLQKPSFLGGSIGINSDKFEGRSVRSGSPFRVDFSSNVIDLEVYGQHYFKNGFGLEFSMKNSITEGARFQIYDDSTVGDTGLDKLDQNEFNVEIGLNKYFKDDQIQLGLDLGYSIVTADKPFYTGKKDDSNDISGSGFTVGLDFNFLTESEKWKFGSSLKFLFLNQDTDVTQNVGGRSTDAEADFKYSVNRDETGVFFELRGLYIRRSNLAFNFIYSYTDIQDKLDNDLKDLGLPTVEDRSIGIHKFTFAPEYWVFNRMKILFKTGVQMYDFSESGAQSINVGGTIFEAPIVKYDYITWFAGINVDILF